MDSATLDALLGELRASLLGQYVGRVRAAGPHALSLELRGGRLWCDAGRETAGLYLLSREEARAAAEEAAASGRTRQAALLARKHVQGARMQDLFRIPGTRTLGLQAGPALLVLRLGGAAPAATLAAGGAALATFGEGPAAWPAPEPDPGREWNLVDPARFAADVQEALARGWSEVRAHLAACPGLGPALAWLIATGAVSFAQARERMKAPVPALLAPGPLDQCDDIDLVPRGAVRLLPFAPPVPLGPVFQPASWTAAASAFLLAGLRGQRFARLRKGHLDGARRRTQRLQQLEARLVQDRRTLPEAAVLRRQAEALLAFSGAAPAQASELAVPDPYDPDRTLRVPLDPALTLPLNANRLFDKARRVDRGARHLEERLALARAELEAARREEAAALDARNAADLEGAAGAAAADARPDTAAGPRRFLTSRGLELLAGRGARENQQITFEVAGPEDWWLHARDVPGAHVVLRDPERRASSEDLREAAEVAAFFSDARGESQADVHATRRKHVRPAGGPGRVRVLHSETLRVKPRDPRGRLRPR